MPDFPILSIIIVAYKSRGEIADCLDSLPSEIAGGAVEVIVVNNSPSDGTGEFIEAQFPRVRYLPSEANLGFGRANNLGLKESAGSYILFLNPDTICNPGALEHCLSRLEAEPDIGLISPKLVLANGSMDLACRRSIPSLWDGFCRAAGFAAAFPGSAWAAGYNLTHLPPEGTYDVGAINGAFMMAPRTVLNETGGFDENFFMYGDDLDLCIRIARAGYRIVYDGKYSIVHLKGLSVAKDYDQMSQAIFDANRDVFIKHFNPRGSALVKLKYDFAFGAWKRVARLRARLRGHKKVRPV